MMTHRGESMTENPPEGPTEPQPEPPPESPVPEVQETPLSPDEGYGGEPREGGGYDNPNSVEQPPEQEEQERQQEESE